MVIAFSGKSKAGKTTSANYLITQYGFIPLSFAGRLKELAKSFYGFGFAELHGDLKDVPYRKYDWSPRDFLIRLGHFCRFHDSDYFVNSLDFHKGLNYVIDDLRFKNEANALKEKGATLIRLERYKKYLNNIIDSSETDLDDYDKFDFKINESENRNLDSLQLRLDLLMDDLGFAKR